ncbi:hypothetical protein JCM11251_007971 [Rhodosporidiobolus azoricus]
MSSNLSDIESFLQRQEAVVKAKKHRKAGKSNDKEQEAAHMADSGTSLPNGQGTKGEGKRVGASHAAEGSPPRPSPSHVGSSNAAPPEEDLLILSLWKRNTPTHQIAEEIGKSYAYVNVRVSKLVDQGVKRATETGQAHYPSAAVLPRMASASAASKDKGKERVKEASSVSDERGKTGKAWTSFDDAALRSLRKKGKSVKKMAKAVERSREEVKQRWKEKEAEWVAEGLLSPKDISQPLGRTSSTHSRSESSTSASVHPVSPVPPVSCPPSGHTHFSAVLPRRRHAPPSQNADTAALSVTPEVDQQPKVEVDSRSASPPHRSSKRPRHSSSPGAPPSQSPPHPRKAPTSMSGSADQTLFPLAPPAPPHSTPSTSSAAPTASTGSVLHARKRTAAKAHSGPRPAKKPQDRPTLQPGRLSSAFLPHSAFSSSTSSAKDRRPAHTSSNGRSIFDGWPRESVERFKRSFEEDSDEEGEDDEGEEEGEEGRGREA